jgi:hypothetical protein
MSLATHAADTAFADLICADPQWLHEEFDALIEASFREPPASPPPAPPRVPPRPGHPYPPSRWLAPGPAVTTSPAARPARGRQRSPPAQVPRRSPGRRPAGS